jgi:hypothetical protein
MALKGVVLGQRSFKLAGGNLDLGYSFRPQDFALGGL